MNIHVIQQIKQRRITSLCTCLLVNIAALCADTRNVNWSLGCTDGEVFTGPADVTNNDDARSSWKMFASAITAAVDRVHAIGICQRWRRRVAIVASRRRHLHARQRDRAAESIRGANSSRRRRGTITITVTIMCVRAYSGDRRRTMSATRATSNDRSASSAARRVIRTNTSPAQWHEHRPKARAIACVYEGEPCTAWQLMPQWRLVAFFTKPSFPESVKRVAHCSYAS